MKIIALSWLLNMLQRQGFSVLLTLALATIFYVEKHHLEDRVELCQQQLVVGANERTDKVITAIERLIEKIESTPAPAVTTHKQ